MAKFPAFLSHNNNTAVAAGTTTLTSSADATYPATNLKILPISKTWRSVAGVLSNVDITMDFGSAQSVNLLALINHNLTSTATIAVAAGTTSGVSNYSNTIAWRKYDAFLYLTVSQSYRYWRIRITDSASTDNYIEAGYVIAASATQLASSFSYGWAEVDQYVNNEVSSEFGVPYIDELFYRMQFSFSFVNKPSAEVSVIRTLFQGAKRNVTPMFFIPDTVTNDGYFGRFQNDLIQNIGVPASGGQGSNYTSFSILQFQEESRGKKIAA